MNIDFKKFKKIKEDKSHAVLKHQDGHEIKILLKPLSHRMKASLKSLPMMAEGGNPPAPDSQETLGHKIGYPGFAEGGDVKASKLDYEPIKASKLDYEPAKPDHPVKYEKVEKGKEPVDYEPMADGGGVGGNDATPSMSPDVAKLNSMVSSLNNPAPNTAPNAPGAAAIPSTPSNDSGVPEGMPNPIEGYQQQLKGLEQQAQATGAMGPQEAQALQQRNQSINQAISAFNTHSKPIQDEFNAISNDIKNGHISDDHYWNNHSKLATGIGLIVAGFNPTNRPNAALDFLKSNLERDTQQQIAEMGQKSNLLSHLSQQFGNVRDAASFVNALKSEQLGNQLSLAAANQKNPMATARLNELAGQLKQSAYPQFLNMQMRQAMVQASQLPGSDQRVPAMINTLRPFAPEVAKEMETRYVPGVGMASVPVPDAARNNIVDKQNVVNTITKLRQFAQAHAGSLNPATISEGKALANIALNQLRTATDQGVIKPSEIAFDRQLIDEDPTRFFNSFRTDPKYKVAEEWARSELDAKRKEYGLPGAPQAPQYKRSGGKLYMKGPNGEAVEIKSAANGTRG